MRKSPPQLTPAQETLLTPGEYHATLNGLRIRYRIAGKGRPLMVQAPGWGVAAQPYEQTFKTLEANFTVIYYDPRGSGESDVPKNDKEINVGAMVEDLEELRKHLGLSQMVLLGHSHGGLIALHYAARYPNRVSHLIPINAQVIGMQPRDHDHESRTHEPRDAGFHEAMQALQDAGGFQSVFQMTEDKQLSLLLSRVLPIYFYKSTDARELAKWFANAKIPVRSVCRTYETDAGYPLDDVVGKITAATLVISGAYDIICPVAGARAVSDGIATSRLHVFQKSAHFPWLEEPKEFMSAVRAFIAGH